MKKLTLILISGMIILTIIGLVFADIIGGGIKPIKRIGVGMDNQLVNLIQSRGIDSISPNISAIQCNNRYCWADIYQEDVINTQWRTEKSYCIEYTQSIGCEQLNNQSLSQDESDALDSYCSTFIPECLGYADYTTDELNTQLNNFIIQRLTDYAESIQEDNDNGDSVAITDPEIIDISRSGGIRV